MYPEPPLRISRRVFRNLLCGWTIILPVIAPPSASAENPGSKQPDSALRIHVLEKNSQGAPDDRAARLALARAYAEAGRSEDAIALLEKDRGGGDDPESLRLLGSAYLAVDRVTDARRCYRRVVRLTEASAADCFTLGRIHLREGSYALAVERLEKASRLGRDDGALHVALASAYGHLGKHLGAVRVVKVPGGVAGRVAGDVFLIEARGNGAFLAAPSASEVFHLRRALDAGVDTLAIHEAWASCWLQSRRYDRALAALEALAPRINTPAVSRARRADFFANLAEARFGMEDVEGFLAGLQQAAELDATRYNAKLAEGYVRAAECYTQRGSLPQTIEYLKLAVAEAPKSADLHYRLGVAYWEAGRRTDAARQWQMTLQIQGNHPAREQMLEWIQEVRAEGR